MIIVRAIALTGILDCMHDQSIKTTHKHSFVVHIILLMLGTVLFFVRHHAGGSFEVAPKKIAKAKLLIFDQNKNKVLLVKNTLEPAIWTLPGGRIEKNETSRRAVTREIQEELGLRIEEGAVEPLGILTTDETGLVCDYEILVADFPSGGVMRLEMEILEVRWFDIHALPPRANLIHFSLIDNYLARIRQ